MMEDWQRAILERDRLAAMRLISAIANHLYPELVNARDREAKLLEIPEMQRLKTILAGKVEESSRELAA